MRVFCGTAGGNYIGRFGAGITLCMIYCYLINKKYSNHQVYNHHYIRKEITLSDIYQALLVEALRYKPEGRGFDSRWGHWNFLLT
jgi:hypothetical protein